MKQNWSHFNIDSFKYKHKNVSACKNTTSDKMKYWVFIRLFFWTYVLVICWISSVSIYRVESYMVSSITHSILIDWDISKSNYLSVKVFNFSILAQCCVSLIIGGPNVHKFPHHLHIFLKDSYWFMFCQVFGHIQYNQSSDSCRIIPLKLHQDFLGFCASSHTNMCLTAWVAIRKHAVGVGRGWESISFFTAELLWPTPLQSTIPFAGFFSHPPKNVLSRSPVL